MLPVNSANSTVAHLQARSLPLYETENDHLIPGQQVSVDHFVCSTKSCWLKSTGKTIASEKYTRGRLFNDHASGYVHVEFQVHLNTHETLQAKENFELFCRDHGVVPQSYLSDNAKCFTSKEFTEKLLLFEQVIRFAGVGAHHHNGNAERSIRTIMSIARTMMLHSVIHWPDVSDVTIWPMAVSHAAFLHNHMPNMETGLSPVDIFMKLPWQQHKFHDFHVWGCPVYVLDKSLADGKKLPRWQLRSIRSMNMGLSDKHASTVPMVLNVATGYITPQFHVVFLDDWFTTVTSTAAALPDFDSPEWSQIFGDSHYQYPFDDEEERLLAESIAADLPNLTVLGRIDGVADAMDLVQTPTPIDVPPLPTTQFPATPSPTAPTAPEQEIPPLTPPVPVSSTRETTTTTQQHVEKVASTGPLPKASNHTPHPSPLAIPTPVPMLPPGAP